MGERQLAVAHAGAGTSTSIWAPRQHRPPSRLVGGLLAALLGVLSAATILPTVSEVTEAPVEPGPAETTIDSLDDLPAAEAASIEAQIAAAQYHFVAGGSAAFPDLGPDAIVAGNPAAGFDATLTPDLLRLNQAGDLDASVDLALAGVGRPGAMAPAPATAAPIFTDTTATIQRGAVTEWYRNDPDGLEQGFTVAARPTGAGPLTLDLTLRGASALVLGEDDAQFVAADGSPRGTYGGLTVVDAAGAELAAHFEQTATGLRIVVADAGATYPVVVDPTIVWAGALEPTTHAAEGLAGRAVAADGRWLVVGAPRDRGLDGPQQGSIYVYFRDDVGVWGQRAKLQLRGYRQVIGSGLGPQLGSAVDIDVLGDDDTPGAGVTVAAGAPNADGSADGSSTAGVGAVAVWWFPGNPHTPLSVANPITPDVIEGRQNAAEGLVNGVNATNFGQSVALDGNLLLGGAPDTRGIAAGCVNGINWTGLAQLHRRAGIGTPYGFEDFLHPPIGVLDPCPRADPFTHFGASVDVIDGGFGATFDRAVVGAPGSDATPAVAAPDGEGNAAVTGAVFTFSRPAGSWARDPAFLTDPDLLVHEGFGQSVAFSNPLDADIAVGAPSATNIVNSGVPEFPRPGRVLLFDLDAPAAPGSWSYVQTFDAEGDHPSDGDPTPGAGQVATNGDIFGLSVSWEASALNLLAGQPAGDTIGQNHGGGVLFNRNATGDALAFDEYLFSPLNQNQATGGYSVALSTHFAAIGTPLEFIASAGLGTNHGATQVFAQAGGSYSAGAPSGGGQTILPAGSRADALFGSVVAQDGDLLAVAAPGEDRTLNGTGLNVGAVYLFRRVAGNWLRDQVLNPNQACDATVNGRFGTSLALDEQNSRAFLAVGVSANTTWDPDSGGPGAAVTIPNGVGKVCLYGRNGAPGAGWSVAANLISTGGTGVGRFGDRVGFTGDGTLLIAAPTTNVTGLSNDGSVFRFENVSGLSQWTQREELRGADITPGHGAQFGVGMAVTGSEIAIGSSRSAIAGGTQRIFTYHDAGGGAPGVGTPLVAGNVISTGFCPSCGLALDIANGRIAAGSSGDFGVKVYRSAALGAPYVLEAELDGPASAREVALAHGSTDVSLLIGQPSTTLFGQAGAGTAMLARALVDPATGAATWTEPSYVQNGGNHLSATSGFGTAVSLWPNHGGALIGQPGNDQSERDAGNVWLFPVGFVEQNLVPPGGAPTSYGAEVATLDLNGDVTAGGELALVSAPDNDSIDVFLRVGITWTWVRRIDAAADSIAVLQETSPARIVVTGADGTQVWETTSGIAWTQMGDTLPINGAAIATNPTGPAGPEVFVAGASGLWWILRETAGVLGIDRSVVIPVNARSIAYGSSGGTDYVAVGLPTATLPGQVYVYVRDVGGDPTQFIAQAVPQGPEAGFATEFGDTLAVGSAGELYISAPANGDVGSGQGGGRLYRVDAAGNFQPTLGVPGLLAEISGPVRFTDAVGAGGTTLAVALLGDPGAASGYPVVALYGNAGGAIQGRFASIQFPTTAQGGSGIQPAFVDVAVGHDTILVSGVDPDQGEVRAFTDITRAHAPAPPTEAFIDVSLDLSTVLAGAAAIPTAGLPPSLLTNVATTGGSIAAATIGSIDLTQAPVGSTLQASPLNTLPLNTLPLNTLPLNTLPLNTLPLNTLAFDGWEDLLVGTQFEGIPIQNLTLADVVDLPAVQALTLGELGLAASPLNTLALAAIALGGLPLNTLPLDPDSTDPALRQWCDAIEDLDLDPTGLGLDCVNLNAPQNATASVLSVAMRGLPLNTLPLNTLPLNTLDIAGTPLNTLPLNTLDIAGTPLNTLPLNTLDIAGTPLNTLPLNTLPLNTLPLNTLLLNAIELGGTPLNTLPLNTLDISDTPLNTLPLNTLPLNTLPLNTLPLNTLPLNTLPLNTLLMGALNIAGSPLNTLPLNTLLVAGSPLNTLPLNTLPLNTLPLNTLPLNTLPLNTLPLNTLPLNTLVLGSTPLNTLPLNTLALSTVIDPATGALRVPSLASIPLNTLPLNTLAAVVDCNTGFECFAAGATLGAAARARALLPGATFGDLEGFLDGVRLGDLAGKVAGFTVADFQAAMANLTGTVEDLGPDFDDLLLGELPASFLSQLVLGQIGGGNALAGITLADLVGLVPNFDLATLEAARNALAGTYGSIGPDYGNVTLGEIIGVPGAGDTLLGQVIGFIPGLRLSDLIGPVFDETAIRNALTAAFDPALTYGELGDYLDLTLGEILALTDMTLGELFAAANPGAFDGITLGDLLLALIARTQYPWERLDYSRVTAQALDGVDSGVGANVAFQTVNLSGISGPTQVEVQLPFGSSFVPGSVTLSTPAPVEELVPVVEDGALVWTFRSLPPAGVHTLQFDLEPTLNIGTGEVVASVTYLAEYATATDAAALTVGEAREPNDTPPTATPLPVDTIVLSHISTTSDIDVFSFVVDEPGSRASLILSNLDADLDMVLYSPRASSASIQQASSRSIIPVEDESTSAIPGATEVAPEPVDDLPVPEELGDLAVSQASINRGTRDERIDTGPLNRVGTYYVAVSGYNGATNRAPFALRGGLLAATALPACAARPVTAGATFGTLPASLPPGTDTLFLVNRSRLDGLYPGSGPAVTDALDEFVGYLNDPDQDELGVSAAVLGIDGDADVRQAYADWDAAPCYPETANAVVAEVVRLLDGYRDGGAELQHIVIVGGDDMIPFARVPDRTKIAAESGYAETFSDGNNALFASFATNHVQTDDAYGDLDPYVFGDRVLFVTDTSVGRLIETPTEIVDQLDDFVAADGLLAVDTGLVTGYDFVADGAHAVADELEPTVTGSVDRSLISEEWTREALELAINSLEPDLASINAHFDHFRALPGLGNATGSEDNLFTAAAVRTELAGDLAGSIVFSMGCHGGLNASDLLVAGGRSLDFAQAVASQGGVFVGNTGYGYGDTEIVALSERLMTLFARRLDGALDVGDALRYAKAEYAADLTAYGVYDEKSLMEATLYGLPFYRLDVADPPPIPPLPPEPVISTDPISGVDTTTIQVTPEPVERQGPGDETYLVIVDEETGEEQTTALHDRPVLPREEASFSLPDGVEAHDALVTGLVTTDTEGVDPYVLQPIFDDGAERVDVESNAVFPSAPVRVNPQATPAGDTFTVSATAAYFRTTATDGTGILRTVDSMTLAPHVAPESDTDFTAPTFRTVDATVVDGTLSFAVTIEDEGDPAGVRRVYVLAAEDPVPGEETTWRGLDLVQSGATNRWSGSMAVTGDEIEFLAQGVDASGNVAITTNKALNFRDAAAPLDPPNPDLVATATGPEGNDGWFVGPVSIETAGGRNLTFEVNGELTPAPVEVDSDGPHTVVVRSSDGQQRTLSFRIDSAGPVATPLVPIDGAALGLNTGVGAAFACLDPGSGSTTCSATLDGVAIDAGDDVTGGVGPHLLEVSSGPDVAGNAPSVPLMSASFVVVGSPEITSVGANVVGTTVTVTGSYTGDPGGSPYQAIITWDDDTTTSCLEGAPTASCSISGGTVSASHTFAGPPVIADITLTVANRFGGADSSSPANLEVAVSGTVGGGGWYRSSVTVTATAGGAPITYDRGDGNGFVPFPPAGATFGADGTYTVVVRALGQEQTATFKLDRTGPAAVLTTPADGATYAQGTTFAVFSCTDVHSGATTCTATLDGAPLASGANIAATLGTHTVVVTAGPDAAGNPPSVATRTATYTVVGGPDVTAVTLSGDGAVTPGGSITATAAFTGASGGAPYTATFNWGDGTPNTTCTSAAPVGTCTVTAPVGAATNGSTSASHTYASGALQRTVTVTVTNRFGASDNGSATVYICSIIGTAAANTLNGTAGNDVICGLAGNDTINGNGGHDVIFGGDGADTVHGNDGNDLLLGGAGNDRLYGDAGNDGIVAGDGDDTVEGGAGNDFIDGGSGNDNLSGSDGLDLLLDLVGLNVLLGGNDDDVLIGGAGNDTLNGGGGNDYLDGGPGVDTLNVGTGSDHCVYTPGESHPGCET